MPSVLLEALDFAPSPTPKTWTRCEVEALDRRGAFEGQRLELVDGKLIDKARSPRIHVVTQWCLHRDLIEIFDFDHLNLGAPIDVAKADKPRNHPEPDLIVLKRSVTSYDADPKPEDLCLVAEVSDSTVAFDRTTKAALYARAEIVEYWLLDIPARRLIVHRDPVQGVYRSILSFDGTERVEPLGAPGRSVGIVELFPQ